MAQSKALTVDEYIAGLSTERHKAIATLRQVVLNNLPEGYMEMMQYGMIGYSIPLSRYPQHLQWSAALLCCPCVA